MAFLSLALLAVAAGLVWYAVAAVVAARRLRAFPGPRLASFSYLWMARAALSGRMWQIYRDVTTQFAADAAADAVAVVRIGPNELLTSDPALIRRLSATRAPQYRRSSWYEPNRLDPYEHSMFSLRDDAAHDRLKARTAAAYAGRENPALEAEVDAVLAAWLRIIRRRYVAARKTLDLATLAQYFALDSITNVAFGQPFGFLDQERDIHAYLQGIRDVAPVMQMCGEIPALAAVVASPLVLALAGPKVSDRHGIGRMMAVARDIVAPRFDPARKHAADRRDMLGAFVRNGMTQRECETEALFQIIVGSDTTATAIRMTLFYIMTVPRVYRRLQAEIDAAVGPVYEEEEEEEEEGETLSINDDKNNNNNDDDEDEDDSPPSIVPHAVADRLPYLQAAILEGLRIHPPFVGLPFKEVPPQGDTLADGRVLPPGTRIAPSLWALSRRRDIFGPDADLFRPERWLPEENGPDARAEMRRTVDLLFGSGRWACSGKSLAFLELNKVLVELLRRFDWQLANPLHPVHSVNHNLFLQSDMWVQPTLRRRPSTKA